MQNPQRMMLVTQNPSLRAILAAVLGMEGYTLMIADECIDLDTSAQARRATILILDEDLARSRRDYSPAGVGRYTGKVPVILLVGSLADSQDVPPPVLRVAKSRAAHDVPAAIEAFGLGKATDHR